jgi:Right handed beta helix region/Disaggregatase related
MERDRWPGITVHICVLVMILCPASVARILYVDDGASGLNDGSSWTHAHRCLQDALAAAQFFEPPVEILVAQGVYQPDRYSTMTPDGPLIIATGDRLATFELISGVAVMGGFAGGDAPDPNARDTVAYPTILTGDLVGNDIDVDADNYTHPARGSTRIDNSRTVVTADRVDGTAVLDGFVVAGGHGGSDGGGGMGNTAASPTVANCVFRGNLTYGAGGGMCNSPGSRPLVRDCVFRKNTAQYGGGVANRSGSDPTFSDCTFSQNTGRVGGGMYSTWCRVAASDCRFTGNSASLGAGMFNLEADVPTLSNCLFSDNAGQALYNSESSDVTMTNCTVAGNVADFCPGLVNFKGSRLLLRNCIVWGNWGDWDVQLVTQRGARMRVDYSNIQGGPGRIRTEVGILTWGVGNVNIDPCFVSVGHWIDRYDPNRVVDPTDANAILVEGDYHLKSQAGRWDSVAGGWMADDTTSPCIDLGDPTYPVEEELAPHGGWINLGAYGGTAEASLSLGTNPGAYPCAAYVYTSDTASAQSFDSLLRPWGWAVTAIPSAELAQTALDPYDVIIVGHDTRDNDSWEDVQAVAAIEGSQKPVVGLGEGGAMLFDRLALTTGQACEERGRQNEVRVVESIWELFRSPNAFILPRTRILQLYTETELFSVHLPTVSDDIIVLGQEVEAAEYCPLTLERDRFYYWGFAASPENMTEVGRDLFVNLLALATSQLEQAETVSAP